MWTMMSPLLLMALGFTAMCRCRPSAFKQVMLELMPLAVCIETLLA
jgi:hypothetical protein